MEHVKQVILIRKDLNMRRGKEIAQGSHASMDFLVEPLRRQLEDSLRSGQTRSDFQITLTPQEIHWLRFGVGKICLRVNSETELLDFHKKAQEAGLKAHLIQDSGRTEFHGEPTFTACAIGPDDAAKIDAVTGGLVLY